MYTDSRKIHIIEAVLKTENDETLSQLEGGDSTIQKR